MSSFDEAFLHEVRERNDIVSVVGDYVALRKAGTSHKGLCPFHGEKTPSFHVHGDRQFFYCFGCQTGGDVISFVREVNGYSFMEAVRHLAERAGIAIPERTNDGDPSRPPRAGHASRAARDGFYDINRIATRFFVETLHTMEGSGCREYLQKRGLQRETIERFALGCAPDRWDGLVNALQKENCDLRTAESLGLLVKKQGSSNYYDRFRNRLMFPIKNIAGEVLGFSGRALGSDPETAKYVNSPDSPLYQKGDNLYGLHEARQAMRKAGRAILVEGNVDMVRLSEIGLPEVVAPLGTALTPAQCRLLKRFVPQAVAIYDGDGAGREAARKAAQLALAEGLALLVASLPDKEDPDTYARAHGKEGLDKLIGKAMPAWEFLVERAIAETRGRESAQGAKLAVEKLAPVLQDLQSPEERAIYQRQLAETLRLDEKVVHELARAGQRRTAAPVEVSQQPVEAPLPMTDIRLLELLVLLPEARSRYVGHDLESLVADPRTKASAEAICSLDDADGHGAMPDLGDVLSVLPLGRARDDLMKRLSEAPAPADGVVAFEGLLKQLRRDAIERKLDAIRRDERSAWLSKDDELAFQLGLEKTKLGRQLESLKAVRD